MARRPEDPAATRGLGPGGASSAMVAKPGCRGDGPIEEEFRSRRFCVIPPRSEKGPSAVVCLFSAALGLGHGTLLCVRPAVRFSFRRPAGKLEFSPRRRTLTAASPNRGASSPGPSVARCMAAITMRRVVAAPAPAMARSRMWAGRGARAWTPARARERAGRLDGWQRRRWRGGAWCSPNLMSKARKRHYGTASALPHV